MAAKAKAKEAWSRSRETERRATRAANAHGGGWWFEFESQESGFRSRDVAKVLRHDERTAARLGDVKVYRVRQAAAGRTTARCVATLAPRPSRPRSAP